MLLKEVHITGFWGKYSLDWELNDTVNILSGINGAGKTTLLDVIYSLTTPTEINMDILRKVKEVRLVFTEGYSIEYSRPSDTTSSPFISYKQNGQAITRQQYQVNVKTTAISTFDGTMPSLEDYQKYILLRSDKIRSELDWDVERSLDLYYRYVNGISQEVEKAIRENNLTDLSKYYRKKNKFLELMNEMFQSTRKTIFESGNGIEFKLEDGTLIPARDLSSGEKQLLILMIGTLTEKEEEFITFWDEPEISLHIDWQRMLIRVIRTLNSHSQLIISTHSPSIIYEGWEKMVVNMEDLLK